MNIRDYRNNNFFAIFTITTSIAVIGIVIGLTIPMIGLCLNSQRVQDIGCLYDGLYYQSVAWSLYYCSYGKFSSWRTTDPV
ncbi:hypothetical protein Ppb6_01329 [Photorhabdus australis subsp. thailandensis]|uniref:Uncharacterized protein n=1 Tax=Photorhabdus australis subsp. thailandensis TaxID=2805096 RepID=A0A1C0U676_9GAMM|nr:hypothetical protein [Photorhabdus australis]OCQ53442.1 hypothetical protein Ppb6_01329 [Photorhabdus australis subsp. thailandensis]